jgi:hypothetical protein
MALPHDTDAEAIPILPCFGDRALASFLKALMITVFFVEDPAASGDQRGVGMRAPPAWSRAELV